jgi:hypothetical protein
MERMKSFVLSFCIFFPVGEVNSSALETKSGIFWFAGLSRLLDRRMKMLLNRIPASMQFWSLIVCWWAMMRCYIGTDRIRETTQSLERYACLIRSAIERGPFGLALFLALISCMHMLQYIHPVRSDPSSTGKASNRHHTRFSRFFSL